MAVEGGSAVVPLVVGYVHAAAVGGVEELAEEEVAAADADHEGFEVGGFAEGDDDAVGVFVFGFDFGPDGDAEGLGAGELGNE